MYGIGDFIASFKGDSPGHPFRGNQYGEGGGASLGGESGEATQSWRNLPAGHPDRVKFMREELDRLKKKKGNLEELRKSGIGTFIGGNKRDFKQEGS